MLLLVHLEGTSFLGSLEMDAERRHAGDGLIDLDEFLLDRLLALLRRGTDQNTSTDAKVTIKPGMPEASAVTLDSQLDTAAGTALAPWLDLEIGAIE